MYFHIRTDVFGPWIVLVVFGEIDLATAPRYRRELVAAVAECQRDVAGCRPLAVDLSACDLIDSVGLGVTVGGARRVGEIGGSFAVVAGERVRRCFERTRLDEIIAVVASVDELDGVRAT